VHLIISARKNNVSDCWEILRNLPARRLLLPFKIIPEKAGKNGCLNYLEKPGN
jgi:hypothetical protein